MKFVYFLRLLTLFYAVSWSLEAESFKARVKKAAGKVEQAVEDKADEAEDKVLAAMRGDIAKHPYAKTVARVRQGTSLAPQEQAAVAARKVKVKEALEKMLGMSLADDQVPTIAFCCSGGGYRAMVATMGGLMGADEIGLLNAATYMAGLSGSTWLLGPWIYRNLSMSDYAKFLTPRLSTDFRKEAIDFDDFRRTLYAKFIYDQRVGIIDWWGAKIVNRLAGDLGNSGQKLHVTDLVDHVKDGSHFFPIFTTIMARDGQPYEWCEFTPYEFGSEYLKAWVPAWSWGRKFQNGVSTDFAPELSLGYLLGICGSAFAADLREMLASGQLKIGNGALAQAFKREINESQKLGDVRFTSARLHNITKGLAASPIAEDEYTTNIDAGIDFNLPFPVVLRPERKVDIIVVIDASATIKNAPALKGAESYAKRKGLKFPKIDYTGVEDRPMSVFKDADPSVPVIVYFPRVKNPAFSTEYDPATVPTTKFVYSADDVAKLSGCLKTSVVMSKDALVDVIKQRIKASAPAPAVAAPVNKLPQPQVAVVPAPVTAH